MRQAVSPPLRQHRRAKSTSGKSARYIPIVTREAVFKLLPNAHLLTTSCVIFDDLREALETVPITMNNSIKNSDKELCFRKPSF